MAQRSTKPVVSVVIPTRGRADYLEVALASLARQDLDRPYEVIVVDDGATDRTPEVVAAAGVRSVRHERRRTLNAARNSGAGAARADLIAFTDDDGGAPAGWVGGLGGGAGGHPGAEGLGGPVRGRGRGGGA